MKNGNWTYGVGSYKRDDSLPQKKDYLDIGQFSLPADTLEGLSVPLNPHMDVTPDLEFDIAVKANPLKDFAPSVLHVDLVGDTIIEGRWDSQGLMQIVPCTFSDYKEAEPDPIADIESMVKSYTTRLPISRATIEFGVNDNGERVDMSSMLDMLFNTSRGAMQIPNEGLEFKYVEAPKYPVEESRMK